MHLVSQNVEDTHAIAARLAQEWRAALPGRTRALVVALRGELGSGKTAFVQGVAKAFALRELPTSPTFNLMKEYAIGDGPFRLWHLDCYRLSGHRDLAALDFSAILAGPHNLVLVEWPERIGDALPADRIEIEFEHLDESRRRISINNSPTRT